MSPRSSSRLKRHIEQESKKQIYISFVVIVLIVILFLTFGAKIFEFIGNTVFLIRGDSETVGEKVSETSTLNPPEIDSVPETTSEETIVVSGTVEDEEMLVELYLNDSLYRKVPVGSDFAFNANVRLKEGKNSLKARTVLNGESSEFGKSITVLYSSGEIELDVVFPKDGQKLGKGDKRIEVRGKTDPLYKVTVNGFRAIVDKDGNFSFYTELKDGDNELVIVAENSAGETKEEKVSVTYSP